MLKYLHVWCLCYSTGWWTLHMALSMRATRQRMNLRKCIQSFPKKEPRGGWTMGYVNLAHA